MPGLTKEQIIEAFKYHEPTSDLISKYEQIRSAGFSLARVIMQNTPVCADQTAAIRLVREAVMTANAAIALDGAI